MPDHRSDTGAKKLVTTDFATQKFIPHGVMAIERVENIMYCEITGPFNREFMLSYFHMVSQSFDGWPTERCMYAITRWSRTMLATPEALSYFQQWTEKYGKQVTTHHLWVIPEGLEGSEFMLPKWSKPYLAAEIPLEIFSDYDQAMARLKVLTTSDGGAA